MKLGILTFHAQLNYGGVLQCWALKSALERMGHEVVVIDRWMSRDNSLLWGQLSQGVVGWCKFFVWVCLGRLGIGHCIRILKTVRFVKDLGLTEYHFVEWKDAPKSLGVDMVIVGSDQVWNPQWAFTKAYLMNDVTDVRRISYAASFGIKCLPEKLRDSYRDALKKFEALSCREKEGVEICGNLGLIARHVVDPTLLVGSKEWENMMVRPHLSDKPILVCYFIGINEDVLLPELRLIAKRTDCSVYVLANNGRTRRFGVLGGGVERVFSCGPCDFVGMMHSAKWILTDSFHAVMFASIFQKNFRFVKPNGSERITMFSRIQEFADRCIQGPWLSNSIKDGVDSLMQDPVLSYDKGAIDEMREQSVEWLKKVLV